MAASGATWRSARQDASRPFKTNLSRRSLLLIGYPGDMVALAGRAMLSELASLVADIRECLFRDEVTTKHVVFCDSAGTDAW